MFLCAKSFKVRTHVQNTYLPNIALFCRHVGSGREHRAKDGLRTTDRGPRMEDPGQLGPRTRPRMEDPGQLGARKRPRMEDPGQLGPRTRPRMEDPGHREQCAWTIKNRGPRTKDEELRSKDGA